MQSSSSDRPEGDREMQTSEDLTAMTTLSTRGTSSFQSSSDSSQSSGSLMDKGSKVQPPRCTRVRECARRFGAWMYPLSRGDRGNAQPAGGAPRLEALDAPRWIASIQIVCYHMYGHKEAFSRYATWFAVWTQLFFLLSGFVLAYAELAKPPKTGNSRLSLLRYVRRRLTVIYPAFFLALLLRVTLARHADAELAPDLHCYGVWLHYLQPLALQRRGLVFERPAHLLALPPAAGRNVPTEELDILQRDHRGVLDLVDVYQIAGNHNRLASALGFGELGSIIVMVAIRATPIGFFNVFIAGVAAARIFIVVATKDADTGGSVSLETRKVALAATNAPKVLRYGCCVGYIIYAGMVAFLTKYIKSHYYFFHNGGMLPVMLLVLLGAAIGTDPLAVWVFRSKPFMVLGRISYLQYLMQHVLQGWIAFTFGWDNNPVAQAVFIPALLVFSYICQRWVEKPYTLYQRWRLEKGVRGCDDVVIERLESGFAATAACLRCSR
eukprot:CAMPEP_0176161140 /NCGR_PEP_ID=MMETSP0120_2-20121206/82436_1 /TAXON_ID=160619 /ORGANISM="Kryptoperidinium foliaceum, Strain CCMP 1326" /LENGTH=494 /DNA_ID=CAMNT_0017498605 /DNA_START=91 /DNA_END=1573 /DNA_ORIENTATION=+